VPASDAVSDGRPRLPDAIVPITVPNLISLGRLVLVPTILWMIIDGHFVGAFIVFVVAGVSDAVDGFIARSFNLRSRLGAYLDPIADKMLLVSIYLALVILGQIPVWLATIVICRDLFIVGGVILSAVLDRPIEVRPLAISKVNTTAQIVFAAAVLADLAFAGVHLQGFRDVMVWVVGVLTVGSAFAYFVDWVRHMTR
jgi:cardiolipin synthase